VKWIYLPRGSPEQQTTVNNFALAAHVYVFRVIACES
jgi:hypothetical protein